MFSILVLGFLIGLRHALEADHLAAVSSLSARQVGIFGVVRHGVTWGIGHSLALFAVAGAAIMFDATLDDRAAAWVEVAVGVMLLLLGGQVIYRLLRDRIHFHSHRHGDGIVHFHAHSHRGETGSHSPDHHRHAHAKGLPLKTLGVGLMHGMAGSAALIVLTATAVESRLLGMTYVVVFGIGSIVGMATLSVIIAAPLAYSSRVLSWANTSLQAAIGAGTMALGLLTIYQSAGQALASV